MNTVVNVYIDGYLLASEASLFVELGAKHFDDDHALAYWPPDSEEYRPNNWVPRLFLSLRDGQRNKEFSYPMGNMANGNLSLNEHHRMELEYTIHKVNDRKLRGRIPAERRRKPMLYVWDIPQAAIAYDNFLDLDCAFRLDAVIEPKMYIRL